jgi:hypothetical protein
VPRALSFTDRALADVDAGRTWLTLFYEVGPDTGRDETAGDVRVLRVYGPDQDRSRSGSSTG